MPMRIFPTFLFRCDLNTIVYSQQTRRSFQRTFQTPDLADRRFEHSDLPIVNHFAVEQVKTVEHQASFWVGKRSVLSGIVICSKLCNEIGGIFCGVDGEGFGDGEKGSSEFCDGQLFSRPLPMR